MQPGTAILINKIVRWVVNIFTILSPFLFSLIIVWVIYTVKVDNNILWPLSVTIIFNFSLMGSLFYTKFVPKFSITKAISDNATKKITQK